MRHLHVPLKKFKSYETNINRHTVSEPMVLIILGVNANKTPTNCMCAFVPLAVWLLSVVAIGNRWQANRSSDATVCECLPHLLSEGNYPSSPAPSPTLLGLFSCVFHFPLLLFNSPGSLSPPTFSCPPCLCITWEASSSHKNNWKLDRQNKANTAASSFGSQIPKPDKHPARA